MEKKEENSIFAIFEKEEETPRKLSWVLSFPEDYPTRKRELVYEGVLTEELDELLCLPKYYVVYSDLIIKFESSAKLAAEGFLTVTNPMKEKLSQRFNKCKGSGSSKYGFSLTEHGSTFIFYCELKEEYKNWYQKLKRIAVFPLLEKEYEIGDIIGKGNYAKVHIGTKYADHKEYAIKSMQKEKLLNNKRSLRGLMNEIWILRNFHHPNIISLYEVYESDFYVHLVLEYLRGGELFTKIQSKGNYCEADAANFTRQLIDAIAYCESRNVIHRDLKPENILLTDDKREFKIVDFGLATILKEGVTETLRCGSPGYVAPEVLNHRGYGKKIDVFSCGVILYILLTGTSPFPATSFHSLIDMNKKCQINYPIEWWSEINPEAKELAVRMMETDPELRISAEEAREHCWLNKEYHSNCARPQIISNLEKYIDFEKKHRFDVSKIKPTNTRSGIITTTPVMIARKLGEGKKLVDTSPLLLPKRLRLILNPFRKESEENPFFPVATPTFLREKRESNEIVSGRDTPHPDAFDPEMPTINANLKTVTPPSIKLLYKPFIPGAGEVRELPYSPGATRGGSRKTLERSTHFFQQSAPLIKEEQKKKHLLPSADFLDINKSLRNSLCNPKAILNSEYSSENYLKPSFTSNISHSTAHS